MRADRGGQFLTAHNGVPLNFSRDPAAEKYISLVQQTHCLPPLAEAENFTQPLVNPGHVGAQFAAGNGVERLGKGVRDAF